MQRTTATRVMELFSDERDDCLAFNVFPLGDADALLLHAADRGATFCITQNGACTQGNGGGNELEDLPAGRARQPGHGIGHRTRS